MLDLRMYKHNNIASLCRFLRDLLTMCHAKIIVIPLLDSEATVADFHGTTRRVSEIVTPPLDVESTALLFGWTVPYVTQRSRNVDLLNPRTFSNSFIMSLQHEKDRMDLYQQMGAGNPLRIVQTATKMSEIAFQKLIM